MKHHKNYTYLSALQTADFVIKMMQVPPLFIYYLSFAMEWLRKQNLTHDSQTNERDPLFELNLIMETVVLGWIKNGRDGLVNGLNDLRSHCGSIEQKKFFERLIIAFTNHYGLKKPHKWSGINVIRFLLTMQGIVRYLTPFESSTENEFEETLPQNTMFRH